MNEFKLPVYMRRYGSTERLRVTKTATGWTFAFQSGPVETGTDGLVDHDLETGLYDLLRREEMSYPADLSDFIDWVWRYGKEADQVQAALNEIGEWVSLCEQKAPNSALFDGLR
jgi:hypothetical protein